MGKITKLIKGPISSFAIITLGLALSAIAFDFFLIPNKIAPGGLSGLATIIYYFTGFPVGVTTLIMNIPLFLLSIWLLGYQFGAKSLFATIGFSLLIDLFAFLPSLTDDLLLASTVGGAMLGLGLGLIVREKATSGGTDMAAAMIARLFHGTFSIAGILFFIDALVVIIAAVSFKDYELGLYAVVSIFIMSRIMDLVILGVDYAQAVFIISDSSDTISSRLLEELERGVTGLNGRGMFTGSQKEVLMCIVKRRDVGALKRIVQEEDKNAFVFFTSVREALGEGFSPHQ